MADQTYLTPEEVSARYRGEVSLATLRNWRSLKIGPSFLKIGKAVLYPRDELDTWDRNKVIKCRDRRASTGCDRDGNGP